MRQLADRLKIEKEEMELEVRVRRGRGRRRLNVVEGVVSVVLGEGQGGRCGKLGEGKDFNKG